MDNDRTPGVLNALLFRGVNGFVVHGSETDLRVADEHCPGVPAIGEKNVLRCDKNTNGSGTGTVFATRNFWQLLQPLIQRQEAFTNAMLDFRYARRRLGINFFELLCIYNALKSMVKVRLNVMVHDTALICHLSFEVCFGYLCCQPTKKSINFAQFCMSSS